MRGGHLTAQRALARPRSCAGASGCTPPRTRTTRSRSRRTSTSELVLPVRFERGEAARVASVRTGSARGGFLRLERRPRATSIALWGKAARGTALAGAR